MPSRTVLLVVVLLTAASVAGAAETTGGSPPEAATTTRPATCGVAAADATTAANGDGSVTVTPLTAPGSDYETLVNATAVRRAVADERLVALAETDYADNSVALGDALVTRITFEGNATGVIDALAAQDRGSPAATFRALVASDAADLHFRGPTACPPELALNESLQAGALRVLPDADRDVLYLVFDTDSYLVRPPGNGTPTATDWRYGFHELGFTLRASGDAVVADTTGETTWETTRRAASFERATNDLLRVPAGESTTLSFETTVAPGTDLEVRLSSLAGRESISANATVNANRTGNVSVTVPEGVYSVSVSNFGDERRLLAAGDARGATLVFGDHRVERGDNFALQPATTHGGFVVVRNASGGLVGVSQPLDPGRDYAKVRVDAPVGRNQTFTATVVRDVDGDGVYDASVDEPYRNGGDPVRATSTLVVGRNDDSTTTTTTGSTDTRTVSSTATTTDTSSPPTDGTDTGGDSSATSPGFGLATAAAGVVTAAAALAGWRCRQASS